LLFPEVFLAVAGVVREPRAAIATGWARYRVRGEIYPALVPEAGARTQGAVYAGIDAAALARLDAFEGPFYVRRALEVECAAGERLLAQAWVLAPGREAELTREPWTPEGLGREALLRFVAQRRAPLSRSGPRSR
jgi:gamma-glutamylcyclotransferase (GGCT)/AIG2-like uncharacterized protein YtfP